MFGLVAVWLEVAGAIRPVYALWGAHHYGFLPRWWLVVGAGGALVLLAVSWAGRGGKRVWGGYLWGALLVAGAALYFLGRERLHFLGDGPGRIDGVLNGPTLWPLEPLGAMIPLWLHRLLPIEDPATTFALLAGASGLVYLGFAFLLAREVALDAVGGLAVFGLLALAGVTRLFYGYVETYPLLAALVTVYLVLAVRLLRGKGNPAVVALAGGLLPLVHSVAIVLLPSLVVALLVDARRRGGAGRALPLLAVPVLGLVAYQILLGRHGSSLAALLAGYGESMLPLGGAVSPQAPYSLFSAAHLADFFQKDLLLGPFAGVFAVILVAIRGGGRLAPEERFLLWAGIPWWIVSFVLNPTLGEPRQWGFNAAGAIPFLMLVGLVLARNPVRLERPRLAGATAGLVLGITFFHTLPWVALGTDTDRSLGELVGLYGPASGAAPRARAAAFGALGAWYLSRKETQNAEMAYTKAVNADTTATVAAGNLASLWLSTGRPGQAADLLAWAVRQTPDREFLYYKLGDAYLALGRTDSAAAAYRRAVTRNRDFLQAYVKLSGALLDLGRTAEAETALVEARKRFPDDPSIQANLGRVAQEKGDTTTAQNLYQEALRKNPEDVDTAFNLGLLLMSRGRWPEAAGYFSMVVDRRPQDAEGWVNLGVCRERQRDAEGALTAYRQAFAIAPGRPEAAMNLVRFQVAARDTAGATATLKAYAARDSTSRYGVIARELLKTLEPGSGK